MEAESVSEVFLFSQMDSQAFKKVHHENELTRDKFSFQKNQEQNCQLVLGQSFIVLSEKYFHSISNKFLNFSFELIFQILYEEDKNIYSKKIGFQLIQGHITHKFHSKSLSIIDKWVIFLKGKLNQRGFHELYKPIQKLGKGNFATVFEVIKNDDGKKLAVKAFSKANCYNTKNGKESLINQLTIMRQLNHQNVIKMEGVYESDNSIYIVLELLKGGQLFHRIQQKKSHFTPLEIKQFMVGFFSGIEHLHQKRIMHRDLKPQNIMLRSKDSMEAVIVDFGLSTYTDIDKYLFFRCGTPGYVAPQILFLQQNSHIEPQCDIFSAGAIFHILLTGKNLFEGTKYDQVYQKNKKMDFNLNSSFYDKFDKDGIDLLKKMLDANPANRIKASQALKHSYFQLKMQEEQSHVPLNGLKDSNGLGSIGSTNGEEQNNQN